MSPTMLTSPRRELYTSRSNNKRGIDCGNGTRGKQSVDVWIERSRKKKSPRNNGDSGLKRTIACSSCIFVRARVCLFIRGTFLIAPGERLRHQEKLRTRRPAHENAALFREASGKNAARWHGNPIRCAANLASHANSRKTDENVRHCSFSFTMSFVYKR